MAKYPRFALKDCLFVEEPIPGHALSSIRHLHGFIDSYDPDWHIYDDQVNVQHKVRGLLRTVANYLKDVPYMAEFEESGGGGIRAQVLFNFKEWAERLSSEIILDLIYFDARVFPDILEPIYKEKISTPIDSHPLYEEVLTGTKNRKRSGLQTCTPLTEAFPPSPRRQRLSPVRDALSSRGPSTPAGVAARQVIRRIVARGRTNG